MAYIGNKPANKAVVASDLDPAVITGQTALAVAPADTDEFLISDAGTLKRIDASLVGGGGITEIDMFNLTTAKHSFTAKSATDTAYISRFASNFTKLGTGMTLVDESHFAFPSTGYYSVQLTGNFTTTTTSETRYLIARIDLSVNGGTNWTDDYATGYQNGTSASSSSDNHGAIARAIVRVSDTSNVYVRGFWLAADNSSGISVDGTSTTMLSGWTFIKLADL